MPHTFICPLSICTPPRGANTPHISLIFFYASVCSERHLYVVGIVGALTCWTLPLHAGYLPDIGDASPYVLHPHSLVAFPCASVCLGISACYMGNISLMLGVWEAFAHLSSFGAWQCIHWVSIRLYLVLFCSSFCLMCLLWLQLLLLQLWWLSSGLSSISSAPSLMGLPATSGQCEVVLPPPLMPQCPWGVTGLASMPQQQPLSSMPLLSYANLWDWACGVHCGTETMRYLACVNCCKYLE